MATRTPSAEVTHDADRSTIRISGYITSDALAPLETAFQQASDAAKLMVVFDERSFINSTGLAILFELVLPMKDAGRDVRIVHPSQHFRKVFDIVGLSGDVPVFGSEDQALAG